MKTTPSLSSLRAGVIGTGFIGPVHIEALRRLGVAVTAVCDVASQAVRAAERSAISQAFADYRALLACPDVDVVHIMDGPRVIHSWREDHIGVRRPRRHPVVARPPRRRYSMNTAAGRKRHGRATRNAPRKAALVAAVIEMGTHLPAPAIGQTAGLSRPCN